VDLPTGIGLAADLIALATLVDLARRWLSQKKTLRDIAT
jgi:hypothetical protein